jgi:hypothetical protein
MTRIADCIDILTKAGWIYEGSTKIEGIRCYIMRRRSDGDPAVQQGVIYFTTYGLRREAEKELSKHETHFA